MSNPCKICKGALWVCESHPDAPWDTNLEGGCQCNAGMPCECNREVDNPPGFEVIISVDEPFDHRH